MKKNLKLAPTKDTLNSFKDIKNYIDGKKSKDDIRLQKQLRETHKMPYKRYKSIKLHVLKKNNQEIKNKSLNSIIAETHKKNKLMTKLILDRKQERDVKHKNSKLKFSYSKKKSKFQNGVLKIGKHILSDK